MTSAGSSGCLVVVSSYTQFDNLAHGPKGMEAKNSMWTFRLDEYNGTMALLSVTTGDNDAMNPAFSRKHPDMNTIYACTESVSENGQIVAWDVHPTTGKLTKQSATDALGTSTCYITLDRDNRNLLIANYWDSTIHVYELGPNGVVGAHRSVYDPNAGRKMAVAADNHVNHSINDESAQAERQSDPHSHAIILDPFYGKIAYVPDLGLDLIRQFHFDPDFGKLTAAGSICSGAVGGKGYGPRYIEFHAWLPIAYVINELSSEICVFEFNHEAANTIIETSGAKQPMTLRLLQTIRTVPEEFPNALNTCGRVTVHKSGDFVLCSNRGHDSIACFRVNHDSSPPGLLTVAQIQHTLGETPRHFQFDPSGQWLIAANQDSNAVRVFRFNLAHGFMEPLHSYRVPSPNFVCAVRPNKPPAKPKL